MWIGVVAAVIVVAVSSGVRAWQGPGLWVTGVTFVVVLGWIAWLLWSKYASNDRDDSNSEG